jgi:hypothetical protein
MNARRESGNGKSWLWHSDDFVTEIPRRLAQRGCGPGPPRTDREVGRRVEPENTRRGERRQAGDLSQHGEGGSAEADRRSAHRSAARARADDRAADGAFARCNVSEPHALPVSAVMVHGAQHTARAGMDEKHAPFQSA